MAAKLKVHFRLSSGEIREAVGREAALQQAEAEAQRLGFLSKEAA